MSKENGTDALGLQQKLAHTIVELDASYEFGLRLQRQAIDETLRRFPPGTAGAEAAFRKLLGSLDECLSLQADALSSTNPMGVAFPNGRPETPAPGT